MPNCRLKSKYKLPSHITGIVHYVYYWDIFDDNYNVSHGFYLNILNPCGSVRMEFDFHYN